MNSHHSASARLSDTHSTSPQASLLPQSLTPHSIWRKIDKHDLARTLFTAACTLTVALGVTWPWQRLPLIALVGIIVGCWPILTEAVHDAMQRKMSMETSMLIAIVAACTIGEWVTALVITTFVLSAEILEDLSMDRGKDALTDLMAFLPDTVQVRDGDAVTLRPTSHVSLGDVVIVAPGGHIPVDGVVVAGHSTADQSRITGESLPVDIKPGSSVFAGSINVLGALEIQATKIAADSSYGRIVAAVQEAQTSEPPVQHLADRLAAWLVYIALAGAVMTYAVTRDLTSTISVVVVAGACGIAAGTPLAVLAAIARIARSGAFIKHGAHLETLSEVDTIIFDKTGTLTTGRPAVLAIQTAPGMAEEDLVHYAASAEFYSEHPLGQAIVRYAAEQGIAVTPAHDFRYTPGRGVTASVENISVAAGNRALVEQTPRIDEQADHATAVYVALNGSYAGTIFIADELRESASAAIDVLHKQGYRTLMFTGDSQQTAHAVAHKLGIDNVYAELLPHEKLSLIDSERAAGHTILMVGDGVNDAPALTRADVGMAMGSGTAIAQETADAVLISSDLNDLAATMRTARRARSIVMFNFIGTITVDLIGIALAACGLLSPIFAALIHVGSETAFILNSARLIPRSARKRSCGNHPSRHSTNQRNQ